MKIQIIMFLLVILMLFSSGLRGQEADYIHVTAVAWSHDGGKIAVAGIRYPTTQGYLRVIDVRTGEIVYSIYPNPGGFTSVDWSPDDRFLAVGGYDQIVWVFDVQERTHVTSLWGHQSTVSDIDWNRDGTHLVSTGNWDGLTILWNMNTYEPIRIVEEVDLFPLTVKFSPDGQSIAIGGEAGVRVYPTQGDLNQHVAWYFRDLHVAALTWSSTGDRIAFGTQTFSSVIDPSHRIFAEVYVIDSHTGDPLGVFSTEDSSIYGMDWSADDRLIATHSTDGVVRVWDVDTGIQAENYTGVIVYPSDIHFSPYGGHLAYGQSILGDLIRATISQADEVTEVFSTSGIQIAIPAPSLERLNVIADLCFEGVATRTLAPAANLDTLPEFVTHVEALPQDAIPEACRADLLAVAAALMPE